MLRITLQESETAIRIVLEGRVAAPWVQELERAWMNAAPRLGSRKVSIDLSNVTYTDAAGKQALGKIFSQSGAELAASSLETHDIAGEIHQKN